MDSRQKEIRSVLTGLVTLDGETFHAAENAFELMFQGLYNGTFAARVFGLTVVKKQFRVKSKVSELPGICAKAFSAMGRSLILKTAPDAIGVLSFPLLHNPCVMTAEFNGNNVLICFYTAKTLRSYINAHRGFTKWKRNMQDGTFTQTEISITPQVIESDNQ